MNKFKFSLLALMLASGCYLPAAITWDFANVKDRKNWTFNRWAGFLPHPQMEFDEKQNALHVFNSKSKAGFGMVNYRDKIAAEAGNKIKISLAVKGNGEISVGIENYSLGKWIAPDKKVVFPLTDKWQEITLELPVKDLKNKKTDEVLCGFQVSKNGELFIRKFTAEVTGRKYPGDLKFPVQWKMFAKVDPSYTPSAAELVTIPAKFNNIEGRKVFLSSGAIDLQKHAGAVNVRDCTWLFAEINSPADDHLYSIGAGADWWMQLFVNGKCVIDTMKNGNSRKTPGLDDQTAKVKLKKGRNIIAVKVLAGKKAVLHIGGANELRNMVKHTTQIQLLSLDNFDDEKAAHSGNPQLIKGNPSPGLLTITGQAVYKTKKNIIITPRTAWAYIDGKRLFSTGIRIQNFGIKQPEPSALSIINAFRKNLFEVKINFVPGKNDLRCQMLENRNVVREFTYPAKLLPADFQFSYNRSGSFILEIKSLVDSSTSNVNGWSPMLGSIARNRFKSYLNFASANGKPAEITVDEFKTAISSPERPRAAVDMMLDVSKTFDPVKENWKLVFADEFNGPALDTAKWDCKQPHMVEFDGKGKIRIKANYINGKLTACGLYSKKSFLYGYFEARLKFTNHPRCWAAFWLRNPNTNPFSGGVELDIFEDYYTRSRAYYQEKKPVLDHNLHTSNSGMYKSWNYRTQAPGTIDDYYVIAAKWTPFETSYYINGKLMASSAHHSPHNSVTFDAMHHAVSLIPSKVVLSTQIMGPGYVERQWLPAAPEKFPMYFDVDYVRVYAMPEKDVPRVSIKGNTDPAFVKAGSVLKIQPDIKSRHRIKAAHLFSNGYLVASSDKAPYTFNIPFTGEFYNTTPYCSKSGRTGRKLEFNGYPQLFSVYVQDVKGNVGNSGVFIRIPYWPGATPYQNKYHAIPGEIKLPHYSEGGSGKAYYDTSKGNRSSKFRANEDVDCGETTIGYNPQLEWLSYHVDIAKAGKYDISLNYGTARKEQQTLMMFIDEKFLGDFPVTIPEKGSWNCIFKDTWKNIHLPAGKHVIRIMFTGFGYNCSKLTFTPSAGTQEK